MLKLNSIIKYGSEQWKVAAIYLRAGERYYFLLRREKGIAFEVALLPAATLEAYVNENNATQINRKRRS